MSPELEPWDRRVGKADFPVRTDVATSRPVKQEYRMRAYVVSWFIPPLTKRRLYVLGLKKRLCLDSGLMNHRTDDIQAEMSTLLAQQKAIMEDPSLMQLSAEESDAYVKRNQRLRELRVDLQVGALVSPLFPSGDD